MKLLLCMLCLSFFPCCSPPPKTYPGKTEESPEEIKKEVVGRMTGDLNKITEELFKEGLADDNRIVRILAGIGYQIILLRKDIEEDTARTVRKKL